MLSRSRKYPKRICAILLIVAVVTAHLQPVLAAQPQGFAVPGEYSDFLSKSGQFIPIANSDSLPKTQTETALYAVSQAGNAQSPKTERKLELELPHPALFDTQVDKSTTALSNIGIPAIVENGREGKIGAVASAKQFDNTQVSSVGSPVDPRTNQLSFGSSGIPERDKHTGALVYSYAFTIPPGRLGLSPEAALTYNSQNTDTESITGYGWSLSIPSIERFNKRGVENLYTDNLFTSSLSGELVRLTGSGTDGSGDYAARIEQGSFLKYSFSTRDNNWTVLDKKGTRYTFGTDISSRQDDANNASRVYKWFISEISDLNGNSIKYIYAKDQSQVYPQTILYTGHGSADGLFSVTFHFERSPQAVVSYKPGFKIVTQQRLSEIEVLSNSTKINRKYSLTYTIGDNGGRSLLSSITETGYDEQENSKSLPPVTFSYQKGDNPEITTPNYSFPPGFNEQGILADVNGDSLPDILFSEQGVCNSCGTGIAWSRGAYLNRGDGTFQVNQSFTPPLVFFFSPNLNGGNPDRGTRSFDINGDGRADLLGSPRFDPENMKGGYLSDGHMWQPATQFGIWFASDPDQPPRDIDTKVADINGDGLPDLISSGCCPTSSSNGHISGSIQFGTGIGFRHEVGLNNSPKQYDIPVPLDWYALFGDVNGDGLADILISTAVFNAQGASYHRKAYLNTGNNTWVENSDFDPPLNFPFVIYNNTTIQPQGAVLVDINGDGLSDLVTPVCTAINTGNGWQFQASGACASQGYVYHYPDFVDLNGDGLLDRVVFAQFAKIEVGLNKQFRPDLLSMITYSSGGTTSVSYEATGLQRKSDGTLAHPKLPTPIDTVKKIETDDGAGLKINYAYTYENGELYYDSSKVEGGKPVERKFSGFQKVTEVTPLRKTTTYYHQGNGDDSASGEAGDSFFKIGLSYRTEIFDSTGTKLLSRTHTKISQTDLGNGRAFVANTSILEQFFEGITVHKDKAVDYTYDTNGNLAVQTSYGEVIGNNDGTFTDTGLDKVFTSYAYAISSSTVASGFVSSETITNQAGTKLKEAKFSYDNLPLGQVSKGNPTRAEHWLDSNRYVATTKTYDDYGNVKAEIDGAGNTTTYSYDSFNLYPASVTNALGHTTRFEYNYAIGKVKKASDPNNLSSEVVYDGLGRVIEEHIPDLAAINPVTAALLTKSKTVYVDQPNNSSVTRTDYLNNSLFTTSYTYLDGLGRPIQARKLSENNNQYAVTDTQYDAQGRLAKTSLPYYNDGFARTPPNTTNALITTFSYDALDRVVAKTNVVGVEKMAYSPWTVEAMDAKGKKHIYRYDAFGRISKVEEYNKSDVYNTTYEYDGLGNLLKITDAQNNVRGFTYNGLSLRTRAEDLHAPSDTTFSAHAFSYDTAGRLDIHTDGEGRGIKATYDKLNRPLTVLNQGNPTQDKFAFVYDTCTFGVGRTCEAQSFNPTGSEKRSYTYNALGLKAKESLISSTLGSATTTDTQTYTYNRQGQPLTIGNPDASLVGFAYNQFGLVEKFTRQEQGGAVQNSITNFDYTPLGQAKLIEYANGSKTVNAFDDNELYRLKRKTTTIPVDSRVPPQFQGISSRKSQVFKPRDWPAQLQRTAFEAGIAPQLQTQSATGTGPVAKYSFEGNATDSSGNANNGLLQGTYGFSARTDQQGVGSGIDLNGKGYSKVNHAASLSPSSQMSFGGWVKLNKTSQTSWESVLMKTSTTFREDGYGVFLETAQSGNNLCGFVSSWTKRLCAQIPQNQWTHIFFAYDGSNLSLYKNGQLLSTSNPGVVVKSNQSPLFIGASSASNTNPDQAGDLWDGSLDEIQIFNRGLSPDEVNQLIVPVAPALTAFYKFENNGEDSSGNGAHGQLFGQPTFEDDANTSFGKAIKLNGQSQYLKIPHSNFVSPKNEISFAARVKLNQRNPQAWSSVLMKNSSPSRQDGYGLYVESSANNICGFVNRWDKGVCTPLEASKWHHIAVTYNSQTLKLYLDGKQVGSSTVNQPLLVNTLPLFVGASLGNNGLPADFWNGSLDEVQIYDKALSDQQVTNLAQTAGNLALSLKFESNADDSSGNNNHGQVTGTASYSDHSSFGKGIDLNAQAHVRVNHASNLSPQNQISFGGFVKLNQTNSSQWESVLMKTSTTLREDGYGMYLEVGQPSLCAFVNRYDKKACVPITPGTWTHVFATYDGSVLKLYKDGLPKSAVTINASLKPNAATLFIGASMGNGGNASDLWNGSLDEINVYTAALNEQDVQALANVVDPNQQLPVSGTIAQDITYTYDSVGNITRILDQSQNALNKVQVFDYDDLHRLISAETSYPGSQAKNYAETFVYSPAGNILQKKLLTSQLTSISSYKYDGNIGSSYTNPHAVSSICTDTGSCQYMTYDKNGNINNWGSNYFVFNWDDRLISSTAFGSGITYAYDTEGQRTRMIATGVAIRYLSKWYNVSESGKATKHQFAGDLMIATVEGSGTQAKITYHHTERLSGAGVSADTQGKIVELTDYSAFGEIKTGLIALGQNSEQRKFIGQEYDINTGFSYLNARYYDSKIGRFISVDPIARFSPENFLQDPQQLNYYSYARNNAINYSDPSGRCVDGVSTIVCIAALAALTGIVGGTLLEVYGGYTGDPRTIEFGQQTRYTAEIGGSGLIQSKGGHNPITGQKGMVFEVEAGRLEEVNRINNARIQAESEAVRNQKPSLVNEIERHGSYEKHVLGINNRYGPEYGNRFQNKGQWRNYINNVISNPSSSFSGPTKDLYWDDSLGTIIINNKNGGPPTAFHPQEGRQYYLDRVAEQQKLSQKGGGKQ